MREGVSMERVAIILTVAPIVMAGIVLLNKLISHTDTEIMWKAVKESPVTCTPCDKGLTIFDEYQEQAAVEREECERQLFRHALISFLIFRR